MIEEIVVDTRLLEAPEPIMKVLELLPKLNKNTYIKMIHRLEPKILFTQLLQKDLNYKIIHENEDFNIYIWTKDLNEKDIKGL